MNVLDSELVVGSLRRQGYELVHEPIEADVILFNTCSVREHAERRSIPRWAGSRGTETASDKVMVFSLHGGKRIRNSFASALHKWTSSAGTGARPPAELSRK